MTGDGGLGLLSPFSLGWVCDAPRSCLITEQRQGGQRANTAQPPWAALTGHQEQSVRLPWLHLASPAVVGTEEAQNTGRGVSLPGFGCQLSPQQLCGLR